MVGMLLIGIIQLDSPGTEQYVQNFCPKGEQRNRKIAVGECGTKKKIFFKARSYYGNFVTNRSDLAGNDKLIETQYPIRCSNLLGGKNDSTANYKQTKVGGKGKEQSLRGKNQIQKVQR